MSVENIKLPCYQSHKKVWALEIYSVDQLLNEKGPITLKFKDSRYADKEIPEEMFSRYKPVPGDFYVEYEDGYKSFSPRKAFLDGYIKI